MDIFTWSKTPSGVLIISYDSFRNHIGIRKKPNQGERKYTYNVGELIPESELDEASISTPLILHMLSSVLSSSDTEVFFVKSAEQYPRVLFSCTLPMISFLDMAILGSYTSHDLSKTRFCSCGSHFPLLPTTDTITTTTTTAAAAAATTTATAATTTITATAISGAAAATTTTTPATITPTTTAVAAAAASCWWIGQLVMHHAVA
jgi:hypothetical protein